MVPFAEEGEKELHPVIPLSSDSAIEQGTPLPALAQALPLHVSEIRTGRHSQGALQNNIRSAAACQLDALAAVLLSESCRLERSRRLSAVYPSRVSSTLTTLLRILTTLIAHVTISNPC